MELKNYRTEHGIKTVLVSDKGHKYIHVLMMDHAGLKVVKVPKAEQRYMRDVIQQGKMKAMSTIVRRFRAYGRRVGMTKAAKSFLTDAMKAA